MSLHTPKQRSSQRHHGQSIWRTEPFFKRWRPALRFVRPLPPAEPIMLADSAAVHLHEAHTHVQASSAPAPNPIHTLTS